MDPRAALGLLAAAGTASILLERPVGLAALAIVCSAALWLRPVGWRARGQGLALAVAIAWSTAFSQGLFYASTPRSPLFALGPLVVWREGVTYGLAQSLRMIALGSAGLALATGASVDRLFAGLVALRVPYGVAFLGVTALRFVPQVAHEWWTVRAAAAARGSVGRAPWRRLLAELRWLRPVTARALRRAEALAETLDARGFDPLVPRTLRAPLRFGLRDAALLGAAWSAVGALAIARGLTFAYLVELWYHPALRPLYAWTRAWL